MDTIPPNFLFLIHSTQRDPRSWNEVRASTLERGSGRSLKEHPGAYLTLVTTRNLPYVTPYACPDTSGCVIAIFALDVLKQRNWHMNLTDSFGHITSNLTLFPWQIDDIARILDEYPLVLNEVVFHDSIPLDPFMTNLLRIPAVPPQRGASRWSLSERRFYPYFKDVGRQELGVPLSALNNNLPSYCWPSFLEEDETALGQYSTEWRQALGNACGFDWAATEAQNQRLFRAEDDEDTAKYAYRNLFENAARRAYSHRDNQDLGALHTESLNLSRLIGYADLDELDLDADVKDVTDAEEAASAEIFARAEQEMAEIRAAREEARRRQETRPAVEAAKRPAEDAPQITVEQAASDAARARQNVASATVLLTGLLPTEKNYEQIKNYLTFSIREQEANAARLEEIVRRARLGSGVEVEAVPALAGQLTPLHPPEAKRQRME